MRNKHLFFVLLSASIIMFSGCEPASDFYIEDGYLQEYLGSDKTVTLPDDCIGIGAEAFYERGLITEVIIPSEIISIGGSAFNNCINLESINLENVSKTIGNNAFRGCSKLKNIGFSDKLEIIGDSAFFGCKSIASVFIPKSINEINRYAFMNCDQLKDVYYEGTQKNWSSLFKQRDSYEEFPAECIIHFEVSDSKPEGKNTSRFDKSIVENVFLTPEVQIEKTKIGTGYGIRAFIKINKETAKTASQENFAEFLEMRVDGKEYNWFTIDFGDGTGITMPGCQWDIAFYGQIDDEGRISGKKYGYIKTVGKEKYLVECKEYNG